MQFRLSGINRDSLSEARWPCHVRPATSMGMFSSARSLHSLRLLHRSRRGRKRRARSREEECHSHLLSHCRRPTYPLHLSSEYDMLGLKSKPILFRMLSFFLFIIFAFSYFTQVLTSHLKVRTRLSSRLNLLLHCKAIFGRCRGPEPRRAGVMDGEGIFKF